MAIASGGALIGVSSLRTLAMQAAASRLPVCALLDARKQEVYAAFYRFENGLPEPMGEEVVVKPEVLLNQLKGEHIFLGSGASAYRSLIVERLGARAHFVAWPSQTTRASHAAALALADLRRGHTLSAAQLLPHYIRRSEAEMLYNRGDLEASL
jgi:tRNA threonylcarbamoyladenosine biosynthesis protein TsaB